jgi:hypothetical protein
VVLVLAACGGASAPGVASTKGSSTTTTTAAGSSGNSGDTAAQLVELVKFVSCIRTHGVADMPEPLSGGGFSRSALQTATVSPRFNAALKACQSLAVASGYVESQAEKEHFVELHLKISECMRTHGFPSFPDPDAQGGFFFNQSQTQSLDMSSPRYAAAAKKCDAPPGR